MTEQVTDLRQRHTPFSESGGVLVPEIVPTQVDPPKVIEAFVG